MVLKIHNSKQIPLEVGDYKESIGRKSGDGALEEWGKGVGVSVKHNQELVRGV